MAAQPAPSTLSPARTGEAPAAVASAAAGRGPVIRRPRCPDCGSTWVGFAVPAAAVVVLADGSLTEITLAHAASCRFLDFADVDRTVASCLDCGCGFNAEVAA